MAAKKAAKKAVTVVKRARVKRTPDKTYHVVVERGPFSAKIVGLYKGRENARLRSNFLESQSNAIYNKYSVQSVDLLD